MRAKKIEWERCNNIWFGSINGIGVATINKITLGHFNGGKRLRDPYFSTVIGRSVKRCRTLPLAKKKCQQQLDTFLTSIAETE